MTDTELRKLDAEIAEKVMGLEVDYRGGDPWYRNEGLAKEYGGRWSSKLPRYSTDIAAAMSVVERMSDLNYDVAMWHRDGATFWEAQFLCNGMIGDEDAETLPLAICKAALSALTAIRDE